MTTQHLTPAMLQRTLHVIHGSGIVDLVYPARTKGAKGYARENARLLLIGWHLCTRLGHETTVIGAHRALTQSLSVQDQWDIGVRRPSLKGATLEIAEEPSEGTLVDPAKPRKKRWATVEQVSYDDLMHASERMRKDLDYGPSTGAKHSAEERARRQEIVEQIVDLLIDRTTIPRLTGYWAIDATGQWAWTRGPGKEKEAAQKVLDKAAEDGVPLETSEIAVDEDGATAPKEPPAPPVRGKCGDAAWGYKTSKSGSKEVGFGFHQHTIVSVPDPFSDSRDEPVLVYGMVITPANYDLVEPSLNAIDRIRAKHPFTDVIGDMAYTNVRAERWAVLLADRGITQALAMRSDNHGVVDIHGATMRHHWLHCPSADMATQPLPPENGNEDEWAEHVTALDEFRERWAFDRKESGLLSPTSKWVCPARAGRGGCHALGRASVQAAIDLGKPVTTPPADWEGRKCCTQKSIDFTPDPTDHHMQRKLAQREYYGSRRWRTVFKRRTFVEGVFGILKNASRQRLRRGQNRLPGLATATLINAIKASAFNEEQLRIWHAETGKGPSGHPLLQPDPEYRGFQHLTAEEADQIDRENLRRILADEVDESAA
jgi:hypothetical protein